MKSKKTWEDALRNFKLKLDSQEPVFVISVVSEMVHIPVWTLRKLDDMGIVHPKRLGKRIRCYSKKQIETLSYVHYLMEERGVNISGIKMILEIHPEGKTPLESSGE